MDSNKPLISIGIPTYNRPSELRKALAAVINQNYRNLEIIVSDNGSTSHETERVVREFMDRDPRISFFKHEINKGIFFNFYFVLEKAKGDYFMWAADDDEWQGTDFLNKLLKYTPENILTFPDAIVKRSDNTLESLLHNYENCETKLDYIKTFCSVGWGHPLYGMFNIQLLNKHQLQLKFADDLAYHMEGELLHKLFLTGLVKYVKEAKILFSTTSSKPSWGTRIDNYITYFKRTLLIYNNANLPNETKSSILNIVIDTYLAYTRSLFEEFISLKPIAAPENTIIEMKKASLSRRALRRLKNSFRVFIKGY